MSLRLLQMGGPIQRALLEERATIARITAQTLGSNESDVDDTLSKLEVCADIQPITGTLRLGGFGMESLATHMGTFEPDVPVEHGWVVKAETGPEEGNHFRVIDLQKNNHHIEAVLQFLPDETDADTIGNL